MSLTDFENQIVSNINPEEVVDFLRDIVKIPSEYGQEIELVNFLKDKFQAWGFAPEIQSLTPTSANLIGTFPGSGNGKTLLLHGHLDVVPPPPSMPNPYDAIVREGKMYGRGTADQKSGIAAMLMATKVIRETDIQLQGNVILACVAQEESEHTGSLELVKRHIKADCAISTEGTGMQIAIGNRGTVGFRITTYGKGAHGGYPDRGHNAIYDMTKIITKLEELHHSFKSVTVDSGDTVKASICVGKIAGGERYNKVSDECSIWIDRRLRPGETQETAKKELLDIIKDAALPYPVEIAIERPDWTLALKKKPHSEGLEEVMNRGLLPCLTPQNHEIFQHLKTAFQDTLKQEPQFKFEQMYTDADFLVNDLKIPTAIFGPGDMAVGHTDGEYVALENVIQATKIYALTIARTCGVR